MDRRIGGLSCFGCPPRRFREIEKINPRAVASLTEILRNSAFWTYHRQYGSFDLNC
jgi:hypothetical protein